MGDLQILGGIHHRLGGHIVRLIMLHRWKLGKAAGTLGHELAGALMGHGAHLIKAITQLFHVGSEPLQILPVVPQQIALVGDHDLRPGGQILVILPQLLVDGVKVLNRVPPLAAGDVHQMDKQPATVDMPQEVMAQAGALGGTFDDAGDIGQDERHALIHIHHAQIGEQRSEVIICDLGMGLGHHGEQRGFAYVGKANQAHIRQELQLQGDIMALSREAGLCKAGHLPGGGGEVHVAPAAPAALGGGPIRAVGHVVHDGAGLGIPDQGASGDPDAQGLAVLAVAALAHAVLAVAGHVLALEAKVHQGRHVVVHGEDDIAAAAAVSPVRATGRDVFFPMKGHSPVSALAGVNGNADLIRKVSRHRRSSYCFDKQSKTKQSFRNQKKGRTLCPAFRWSLTARSLRRQRPFCAPCPCAQTSPCRPRGRTGCHPYPYQHWYPGGSWFRAV